MSRMCFSPLLTLCAVQALTGQPAITSVLNGASYRAVISPGCWTVVYGTDFAAAEATAQSLPLPQTLGNVSVTVDNLPAALYYVSPRQINMLVPFEVTIPASGVYTAKVVVTTPKGSSTYFIRLTRNAPALFTQNSVGTGPALVFDPRFQPVSRIVADNTLILYATGLGPANPPGSSNAGTASLSRIVDTLDVYVGDQKGRVDFAGLAPLYPRIYQINVTPAAILSGRLYLRQGGWQSNVTQIGSAAGGNVANVTGSIDPLIIPGDPVSYSVSSEAAKFTASFDILPNAKPFVVAAVGDAASFVMNIDPAAGRWSAISTVPTVAQRSGDFSVLGLTVWDFLSCDSSTASCTSFPNAIIPITRLDLATIRGQASLPLANTSGLVNNFLQSGTLMLGSRFSVEQMTAAPVFGGFVQLPYGPFPQRGTTFQLYVDGALIASKDLSYAVIHR